MSRQNKVNPGMYTQRGRLTQDDAARELKRQREVGSQHTWQPVKKDQRPRPAAQDEDPDNAADTTDDGDEETAAKPAANKKAAKPAAKKTAKTAAKKSARTAPKRQAVLARNTGGGRPKPRQSVKSSKK
jgi:hypothetical protein